MHAPFLFWSSTGLGVPITVEDEAFRLAINATQTGFSRMDKAKAEAKPGETVQSNTMTPVSIRISSTSKSIRETCTKMRKNEPFNGMLIRCWLLWFLAVFCNVTAANAQDVSFCAFPISKAITQANASFIVIYEFDVSQDGQATNIKVLEKGFAEQRDVRDCIEQWRLLPFATNT